MPPLKPLFFAIKSAEKGHDEAHPFVTTETEAAKKYGPKSENCFETRRLKEVAFELSKLTPAEFTHLIQCKYCCFLANAIFNASHPTTEMLKAAWGVGAMDYNDKRRIRVHSSLCRDCQGSMQLISEKITQPSKIKQLSKEQYAPAKPK